MKFLACLSFLAVLTVAQATPAVISRDSTGVIVNGDLARNYATLCQRYPGFGDKVGDGVFVLDVDQFHIDNKHYADYLNMVTLDNQQRTKQVSSNDNSGFWAHLSR